MGWSEKTTRDSYGYRVYTIVKQYYFFKFYKIMDSGIKKGIRNVNRVIVYTYYTKSWSPWLKSFYISNLSQLQICSPDSMGWGSRGSEWGRDIFFSFLGGGFADYLFFFLYANVYISYTVFGISINKMYCTVLKNK